MGKKMVVLTQEQWLSVMDAVKFMQDATESSLREHDEGTEDFDLVSEAIEEWKECVTVLEGAQEVIDVDLRCDDWHCSEEKSIIIDFLAGKEETIEVEVQLEDLEYIITSREWKDYQVPMMGFFHINTEWAIQMLQAYWENQTKEWGAYWFMDGKDLYEDYKMCRKSYEDAGDTLSVFQYFDEFEHQEGFLNPESKVDCINRFLSDEDLIGR
jgi:hypothetical protein